MTYERITTDPAVMGGLPCIRGLRFPVATVLAMLADGMGAEDILAEHPDLTVEDVHESLLHAAEAVRERELPLRLTASSSSSTITSRRFWPTHSRQPDTISRPGDGRHPRGHAASTTPSHGAEHSPGRPETPMTSRPILLDGCAAPRAHSPCRVCARKSGFIPWTCWAPISPFCAPRLLIPASTTAARPVGT